MPRVVQGWGGSSYQLCLSVCRPLVQRHCQRLYRNQYSSWVIWSYSSSCTTKRRLAQPHNVDVFVLTVHDKIQCKLAS